MGPGILKTTPIQLSKFGFGSLYQIRGQHESQVKAKAAVMIFSEDKSAKYHFFFSWSKDPAPHSILGNAPGRQRATGEALRATHFPFGDRSRQQLGKSVERRAMTSLQLEIRSNPNKTNLQRANQQNRGGGKEKELLIQSYSHTRANLTWPTSTWQQAQRWELQT